MQIYSAGGDPCYDEKDMPDIGKSGERGKRIVQAGGICKDGCPAKRTITHEECKQRLPGKRPAQPWVYQEQVHGNAAELEREIPPVILAAAQDKSQRELFPYLAAEHEDAAYEKENIRSGMFHAYRFLPDRYDFTESDTIIAQS